MRKKTLVLAHRGFSGKYPENTMLAFEKAYEAGADGIELDVQLSKDGEVVIIHDSTVDRTTNGNGLVSKLTFKEIRTLDAAYQFKNEVGAQEIPSLNDYLQWVQDKDLLTNIELKTSKINYDGIEEKVIGLIRKYHLEEKVIVSSFNPQTIRNMKFLDSQVKCGLLTMDFKMVKTANTPTLNVKPKLLKHERPLSILEVAEKLGVEYVHPNYFHLQPDFEKLLEQKGIQINTWTVNDELHMQQLKHKNLNSIITNYPDKLKLILKETKELQKV